MININVKHLFKGIMITTVISKFTYVVKKKENKRKGLMLYKKI